MRHNLCDTEKAKALAEELGMTIEFKDSWDEDESSAVRKLIRQAASAEKKADDCAIKGSPPQTTDYEKNYCRMLYRSPQINWDGRLLGCCVVFDTDWGMNVFKRGLLECINSDEYLRTVIRQLRHKDCPAGTPCETCPRRAAFREESYV